MDINLYLLLVLLGALLVIGFLLAKLHRVRGQLCLIKDALTDIKDETGWVSLLQRNWWVSIKVPSPQIVFPEMVQHLQSHFRKSCNHTGLSCFQSKVKTRFRQGYGKVYPL